MTNSKDASRTFEDFTPEEIGEKLCSNRKEPYVRIFSSPYLNDTLQHGRMLGYHPKRFIQIGNAGASARIVVVKEGKDLPGAITSEIPFSTDSIEYRLYIPDRDKP